MKPKKWSAYITRQILDPAIPMISKECTVIVANHKGRPPTRNELLKAVRQKDAILCTLSDVIDAKVMDAAGPNLKVISSYSTGIDHIDIKEATKRGIYVTFAGDILTDATAGFDRRTHRLLQSPLLRDATGTRPAHGYAYACAYLANPS